MTQITSGFRSVFSSSAIYSLYQNMVFPKKPLVRDYIKPFAGQKILDIGCGPADIANYLKNTQYLGLDFSQKYIEAARKRYGNSAAFEQADINNYVLNQAQHFDLVLSIGVLHHMEDNEVLNLIKLAKQALHKKGRFFVVEPCYVKDQSYLAKFIISKDRGQNVRDEKGYLSLVQPFFNKINVTITHNLLRIPFTMMIMDCSEV
jgi:SAM-dependent methyltransferase